MDPSINEQKQLVLKAFNQCYSRLSTRKRWNILFTLLIPTCFVWLLIVLADQFQLIPFGETLSRMILGVGTIGSLIVTWKKKIEPSYAAYVFDRLNQFNGAFLTWFSGRNQTSEIPPVQTALLLEIHNKLSKNTTLPDRVFPSAKAFATGGLLASGLLAGYAIHIPNRSDLADPIKSGQEKMAHSKRPVSDNLNKKNPPSVSENNPLTDHQANELINRLNNLRRELKSVKRRKKNVPDHLIKRRDRLEKEMTSFLKNKSSSSTSVQPGPSTEQKSGGPVSKQQKQSAKRSTKTRDQKDNSTRTEETSAGRPDRWNEKRNFRKTGRKKLQRALNTLRQEKIFQKGAVGGAETTTAGSNNRSDGSVIASNMSQSNIIDFTTESNEIQLDELNDALNRSDRIRNWAPKYDRSIQAYRSFLRTSILEEKTNEKNR